jgi:hypothetical protein
MKLLNNYLETLNAYPRFKKSKIRRFMGGYSFKLIIISFVLLLVKMLAEYLVETFIL